MHQSRLERASEYVLNFAALCGSLMMAALAVIVLLLIGVGIYSVLTSQPRERMTVTACISKGGKAQLDRYGELDRCLIGVEAIAD